MWCDLAWHLLVRDGGASVDNRCATIRWRSLVAYGPQSKGVQLPALLVISGGDDGGALVGCGTKGLASST